VHLLLSSCERAEPLASSSRLAEIIVSCWPYAQRSDVELLSECLVRLAISYAMLPAGPATMTAT
jgi:hypothetical protein